MILLTLGEKGGGAGASGWSCLQKGVHSTRKKLAAPTLALTFLQVTAINLSVVHQSRLEPSACPTGSFIPQSNARQLTALCDALQTCLTCPLPQDIMLGLLLSAVTAGIPPTAPSQTNDTAARNQVSRANFPHCQFFPLACCKLLFGLFLSLLELCICHMHYGTVFGHVAYKKCTCVCDDKLLQNGEALYLAGFTTSIVEYVGYATALYVRVTPALPCGYLPASFSIDLHLRCCSP